MIKPDSGRGYYPDTASFQKGSIASGACADNKRICICHHTRINAAARCINHIGPPLKGAPDEGYIFVYDNLHITVPVQPLSRAP